MSISQLYAEDWELIGGHVYDEGEQPWDTPASVLQKGMIDVFIRETASSMRLDNPAFPIPRAGINYDVIDPLDLLEQREGEEPWYASDPRLRRLSYHDRPHFPPERHTTEHVLTPTSWSAEYRASTLAESLLSTLENIAAYAPTISR